MFNVDDATYEVDIEDVSLIVRKIEVAPNVIKENAGKTIPYPITRVIQKEFSIPAGGNSFTENNLHQDVLPTKIVLGLVNNVAHVGNYKFNPFNFHHYDVSEMTLKINGQVVDGRPLYLNFDNDVYNDGYWSLCRAMDQRFRDEGMQVSREYYKGGYALYAYDTSASHCNDQYKDTNRTGSVSVELKFARQVPHTLTLCVYLQFDSEIQINEAREVITFFN